MTRPLLFANLAIGRAVFFGRLQRCLLLRRACSGALLQRWRAMVRFFSIGALLSLCPSASPADSKSQTPATGTSFGPLSTLSSPLLLRSAPDHSSGTSFGFSCRLQITVNHPSTSPPGTRTHISGLLLPALHDILRPSASLAGSRKKIKGILWRAIHQFISTNSKIQPNSGIVNSNSPDRISAFS